MDVVQAPREPPTVAIERTATQPRMARPPIPGDHPVVEREAKRRQALVVLRDRGQTLQDVPQVVSDEPHEAAQEPWGVGRDDMRRIQPPDEPAGHGEGVRPGGGRLEHRHGIGGQVGPARVPAGPRAFQQGQARQVAERLGDVDGSSTRDPLRQASQSKRGRGRTGVVATDGDHPAMIRRVARSGRRNARVDRTQVRYSPAMRARDVGVRIGLGAPGPLNAITDVAGVTVGHTTLIRGDGPLVVGEGPVRTGVTVVCPRGYSDRREPVFAGCHRLNGNGELTGLEWVRKSGMLTTPVAITNTHSVGVVRDALVAASVTGDAATWSLPVVGETYDGLLNDMNGFHVRAEHLHEALAAAKGDRSPKARSVVAPG